MATRISVRSRLGAAIRSATLLSAIATWSATPPAFAEGGIVVLDEPAGQVRVGAAISFGMLFTDDGGEPYTHVVGNELEGTILFLGARSNPFGGGDWVVGGDFELDILTLGSDEVSQADRKISGITFETAEASVWLKSHRFGTLTAGLTGGGSDGSIESDLSQTEVVANPVISDIAGNYAIRLKGTDGELINLTWDSAFSSFDQFGGPDGEAIRYESPAFHGFSFAAAVARGVWDAAVQFDHDQGPFEIEAIVGYYRDSGDFTGELPGSIVTGSIAGLHKPTGVSLAFAAGIRTIDEQVELNNGSFAAPADQTFQYAKLGLRRPLFPFGDTAIYAEYGRFQDGIGAQTESEVVAELAGIDPADACIGGGNACVVSGSDASVLGFGIVQQFDDPRVQTFLGYRMLEADVRLTDIDQAAVAAQPLNGLGTVFAGVRIDF